MSELGKQVMVRITPALAEALQADAEANERTVSQTIRLAIKRYLAPVPPPETKEADT